MDSSPQSSHLYFRPLMISMVGILSTALAILTYNFILTKYCARRNHVVPPSQPFIGSETGAGVRKKVLESIPIIVYSKKHESSFVGNYVECTICLGDLEEGDAVRLLPNCQHVFHVHCIDEWFLSHSNCPVCRSPITPIVAPRVDIVVDVPVEDVREESERLRSNGLLRHCASQREPGKRDVPLLPVTLKRSLSVDNFHVSLKIKGKYERESSSSSSSSALSSSKTASLTRGRSLGRLGRSSSLLMKSFGRLQLGRRNSNEILPL